MFSHSIHLIATSLGRSKWLSLLSGSYLQGNCGVEGFNALGLARIGIFGNNENDCRTPDTLLGVGNKNHCSFGTYSGNVGCFASAGDVNIPAAVSILIK